VTPNPATTGAALSYTLMHAGTVSCRVYDAAGSLVRELAPGVQSAGPHRLDLDLSTLRPGTYFCTVQSGTETSLARLTKAE
jgi:hypothetical protein